MASRSHTFWSRTSTVTTWAHSHPAEGRLAATGEPGAVSASSAISVATGATNAPTTGSFEMASDVVRSVPTGVDRVSRVSFKATGDKLGTLFDGSQQLISVTAIPWYSRQVYLPAL